MKVKFTQLSPTLCDLMDYTVHRIFQARILEWVAFPFSRGSFEPRSPALQADSLPAEPQGKPMIQAGGFQRPGSLKNLFFLIGNIITAQITGPKDTSVAKG